MKKIAAIGLLVLLLYNMFGLTTAILLFDKEFKSAASSQATGEYQLLKMYMPSLPYAADWENSNGFEGLTKSNGNFYNATHVLHTNDTLYVTLKSNQTARDRFLELASDMQSITDPGNQSADSPQGKALKLLDHLLKIYVQHSNYFLISDQVSAKSDLTPGYAFHAARLTSLLLTLSTPPPELG